MLSFIVFPATLRECEYFPDKKHTICRVEDGCLNTFQAAQKACEKAEDYASLKKEAVGVWIFDYNKNPVKSKLVYLLDETGKVLINNGYDFSYTAKEINSIKNLSMFEGRVKEDIKKNINISEDIKKNINISIDDIEIIKTKKDIINICIEFNTDDFPITYDLLTFLSNYFNSKDINIRGNSSDTRSEDDYSSYGNGFVRACVEVKIDFLYKFCEK